MFEKVQMHLSLLFYFAPFHKHLSSLEGTFPWSLPILSGSRVPMSFCDVNK